MRVTCHAKDLRVCASALLRRDERVIFHLSLSRLA